jgi:hypothetical protein
MTSAGFDVVGRRVKERGGRRRQPFPLSQKDFVDEQVKSPGQVMRGKKGAWMRRKAPTAPQNKV